MGIMQETTSALDSELVRGHGQMGCKRCIFLISLKIYSDVSWDVTHDISYDISCSVNRSRLERWIITWGSKDP